MRYLVAALAGLLASGVGLAAEGSSGSLPNAEVLKQRLAESGLEIVYREGKPHDDGLTVLGGVAHGRRGGRVGFEFVFDADGEGSTSELGTIGFPTEIKIRGPFIEPIIRGVLKNVAYANYYLGRAGRGEDDLAVTYRLDDALFGMFPSDDAEVNPILDEAPD